MQARNFSSLIDYRHDITEILSLWCRTTTNKTYTFPPTITKYNPRQCDASPIHTFKNYLRLVAEIICLLLLFYILATSKAIFGQAPTGDGVHLWQLNSAATLGRKLGHWNQIHIHQSYYYDTMP